MGLFDPDGRNSIQTVGHWGHRIVQAFCLLTFIVTALPVCVGVYHWQTMKRQQGVLDAIRTDIQVSGVVVDFNVGQLQETDHTAYVGWMVGPSPQDHLNPAYQGLPFSVTYLRNRGNARGPMVFHAEDRQGGNAWMLYNMPFEKGWVYDKFYNAAYRSWIYNPTTKDVDPFAQERIGDEHYSIFQTSMDAAKSDPWFIQGVWKLAPTRRWDWGSGVMLAHAKTSYNYRAYVEAARATARMRHLAAVTAVGGSVTSAEGSGLNPVVTMAALSADKRARFIQAYRTAFQGTLPTVLLVTNNLSDKDLQRDPALREWFGRVGEQGWRMFVHVDAPATGPYVTGVLPWAGYHPYDRASLSLKFSYGDFFLNSLPEVSAETKGTLDTLHTMQTLAFWAPRLRAAGVTDLTVAEQLLADARKQTDRDYALIRRYGHTLLIQDE